MHQLTWQASPLTNWHNKINGRSHHSQINTIWYMAGVTTHQWYGMFHGRSHHSPMIRYVSWQESPLTNDTKCFMGGVTTHQLRRYDLMHGWSHRSTTGTIWYMTGVATQQLIQTDKRQESPLTNWFDIIHGRSHHSPFNIIRYIAEVTSLY